MSEPSTSSGSRHRKKSKGSGLKASAAKEGDAEVAADAVDLAQRAAAAGEEPPTFEEAVEADIAVRDAAQAEPPKSFILAGGATDLSAFADSITAYAASYNETRAHFWTRVAVLCACNVVAGVIFFLLFTGPELGFGPDVNRFIRAQSHLTVFFAIGGGGLLLLLYLADFSFWKTTPWWQLKTLLVAVVAVALAIAFVLASDFVPGTHVALFIICFPLYIWAIQANLYAHLHVARFLLSMGVALMALAAVFVAVWVSWIVAADKQWNASTKLEYAALAGCEATPTAAMAAASNATVPVQVADAEVCLSGWLLWISPFLGAGIAAVFGVSCFILANSVKQVDKPLTIAMKIFLAVLMMAVVGMWVAASVAGAGMRISNAVQLFAAVFVAVLCGVVIGTVGWRRLQKQLMQVPLIRKASRSVLSDWVKAIFLLAFGWALPLYALLALLNAFFRRHLPFGYRIESADERRLWLTKAASAQFTAMRGWQWAAVLLKVVYLALFYVLVVVGVAKLVTLFLHWLNGVLSALPLAAVIGVFMVIGLIMFLLPPVPGVPVYLFGGVVIGSRGEADLGFGGAVAVAVACACVLKMIAITMQQKLIGEQMGRLVAVRRMVGVNSITIRAIRTILAARGLTWGKVAILCGGPDWPTSVLTGILRQSLAQMLIGSLPIIFLVAPAVLAGAFLLKRSEGGSWSSISSVTLAVAALVQVIALLAAAYYIEDVSEKHFDELSAEKPDEAVEAADKKAAEAATLYAARTQWRDLPLLARLTLALAALVNALVVYVLAVASSLAFRPFDVTGDLDAPLDAGGLDGSYANVVVSPTGLIVVGLFGLGALLLVIVRVYFVRRVAATPADFVIDDAIRARFDGTEATAAAASGGESDVEMAAVAPATTSSEAAAAADKKEQRKSQHPFPPPDDDDNKQ